MDSFDESTLFGFAFCGNKEAFDDKLRKLSEIAEEEIWTFDSEPFTILRYYILDTFKRCKSENKIIYSEDGDFCTFNTGLLTKNSQDILAFFKKNNKPDQQKWKLSSFISSESLEYMNHFDCVAPLAKYWADYGELYFDPSLEIQLNIDHILDDNWERILTVIGDGFNKYIVKQMLQGALNEAVAKIRRNMRLVVPQFYREKIMFLIPITFQVSESKCVTLAMAVEKMNAKQYRANTIFTLEMAYGKARQLMKPESNWLLSDKHE